LVKDKAKVAGVSEREISLVVGADFIGLLVYKSLRQNVGSISLSSMSSGCSLLLQCPLSLCVRIRPVWPQ